MSDLGLMVSKKNIFLSIVLVISSFQADANVAPRKKVEVKIYYEALCGDSIQFMRGQLTPAFSRIDRFKAADIKFVPYGHVFNYIHPSTNKTALVCQHGRNECELNAQHACIIENNSKKETFDMITCLMSGYRTKLDRCSALYRVNVDAAKQCKATRNVPDILAKYGKETDALNPSFVPAISFDGIFDWDEQDEILKNFDAVFCRKYNNKFNETLSGC